jgi:hypothetical protein
MFEVSSDIYFVVYNLYYVGQNNDQGARVRPIHRDGGSNHQSIKEYICLFLKLRSYRKNLLGIDKLYSVGAKGHNI